MAHVGRTVLLVNRSRDGRPFLLDAAASPVYLRPSIPVPLVLEARWAVEDTRTSDTLRVILGAVPPPVGLKCPR
jgi:hypothetical protein